ncbi:hypothetical protein EDC04DRAFT_2811045 [Pisolithus marmoratus]|nr:hypothetical protein EDC04DRAFT_2811045 [Pisolithus marmoratus]
MVKMGTKLRPSFFIKLLCSGRAAEITMGYAIRTTSGCTRESLLSRSRCTETGEFHNYGLDTYLHGRPSSHFET